MKFNRGLFNALTCKRYFSCQKTREKVLPVVDTKQNIPKSDYDTEFVCNPLNRNHIAENIKRRRSNGDIDKILHLYQTSNSADLLAKELSKVPNSTHPAISELNTEPRVLNVCGNLPEFDFTPKEFEELLTNMRLLRTEGLGPISGHRSYVLLGDLANLEQALIAYSLERLKKCGFKVVSVPDILPTKVIERCGLIVDGNRTLVYQLDPQYGDEFSLSGTAEMALAYKLTNSVQHCDNLPIKLAAVSRCFRAETSSIANERGIYRVHQFTKVEMFACSEQEKSEEVFNELQGIQEDLFSSLGLHFKVLDMPPYELGPPAVRKIDIEGWLPGRKLFGELSSCSNCTDFQSRRLNIKYESKDGKSLYVHTLNGTACAIPRMLIALCETHQLKDRTIGIPVELQPFMKGKTVIRKQSSPIMRAYKYKRNVI